jgi:hypothetical protein
MHGVRRYRARWSPFEETLSVDEKIARLAANLAEFLAKVID